MNGPNKNPAHLIAFASSSSRRSPVPGGLRRVGRASSRRLVLGSDAARRGRTSSLPGKRCFLLEEGKRMSEERPVPRRESPWGLPEGDKRQPKAHRCNDRAEDVVQACFEGNPFKTVPGPFKLFWQCMRSNPGEEPTEPYTYLQLDPPKRAEAKLE
ncbi:hypothetical protein EJB05_41974, partial [Eragrostis curvula]